jgi:hypothetical protein
MDEPVNLPDIGAFGQMPGFSDVEWRDGAVCMEMDIRPEHLNRSGSEVPDVIPHRRPP